MNEKHPLNSALNSSLNYANYLKLDKILSAQAPRSSDSPEGPEHDEMLFIIIHQVFELWFKQLLHELDYIKAQLDANELGKTLHVLKRLRNIVKVMVSQVDVIETMTPLDFSAFRQRLDSASGLQSVQFREVEFALGFKRQSILSRYEESSEAYKSLKQRLLAPSLWDSFLLFISKRGYQLPEDYSAPILDFESSGNIDSDNIDNNSASEAIVTLIETIYKNDHELSQLCESLIDLDEGIQEWRYRHVKMVQRTIGIKQGTGGSSGADYLMASLNKPIFPALWQVRTRL